MPPHRTALGGGDGGPTGLHGPDTACGPPGAGGWSPEEARALVLGALLFPGDWSAAAGLVQSRSVSGRVLVRGGRRAEPVPRAVGAWR